jgi:hypothetical protein
MDDDRVREAFVSYLTDASIEIPCMHTFGHYFWQVSAVDHLGLQLRHTCGDWEFPDQPEFAGTLVVEIPASWLLDRNYGELLTLGVGTSVTTIALPGKARGGL